MRKCQTSSESKAQGAALRESHTLGILFLSFRMNREHRQMLVPHQDSSIRGRRHLAQHLAAGPCPEGTSCPRVTISRDPPGRRAGPRGSISRDCPVLAHPGCPAAIRQPSRVISSSTLFLRHWSWVTLPWGSRDAR